MPLKKTARNVVCWLLASGLILLGYVKRAKQKSFQEGIITAIYSHNPNMKLFRKIMLWLKNNGYTFISCDQLIDILNKKVACPKGAAWISLDDGWKGNLDNVVPIAVHYNIPITIFVCTGSVESGVFWWRLIIEHARHIPAEFRNLAVFLQMPDEERRQVLEKIERMISHSPARRDAMTVEDVRNISSMPQITIGSHTESHPALTKCTDPDIGHELEESKRKLEEWTGKPIKAFSYPNGVSDDRIRWWLKEHGYELAAATERRFARSDDDCYLLPRTDVMDNGSFAENLCHALGIWGPVIDSLKGIIRPRRWDKTNLL
jgi:peptidoglycan/xylan/chitin deacetylase (PgdA/CDA1 family)